MEERDNYDRASGRERVGVSDDQHYLVEALPSIAEQERVIVRQRRVEEIAAAKEKGKHLGRPEKGIPASWEEVFSRWQAGEITPVTVMKELGIKKNLFYKLVHLYRKIRQIVRSNLLDRATDS